MNVGDVGSTSDFMEIPPPDFLRQIVSYVPETGSMTWMKRDPSLFSGSGRYSATRVAAQWNSCWAGKPAFANANSSGYLEGKILDRKYLAHRIAWTIFHGEPPKGFIDHINGDKHDNRIANLRVVTREGNGRNCALSKRNKTGFPGVKLDARYNTWSANIHVNGKRIHLGSFRHKEEAVKARKLAEAEYGFHANHGRHTQGG